MSEASIAEPDVAPRSSPTAAESLRDTIEHAAHLLPAQGPIEAFVHHNTLHAFEHLPFHEAVKAGWKTYGANPYLPEEQYRALLDTGRISHCDLEWALRDRLGDHDAELVDGLGSRFALRMAMLKHPFHRGPAAELQWVVAETDALSAFRSDASANAREQLLAGSRQAVGRHGKDSPSGRDPILSGLIAEFGHGDSTHWNDSRWEKFSLAYLWRVCRHGVHSAGDMPTRERPVRLRDILLEATGEDMDRYVHGLLIRFCAAFLDQGYADWEFEGREHGFYQAFLSLYAMKGVVAERWNRGLSRELRKLRESKTSAIVSISESLQRLGIDEVHRDEFITQSLLALGGWAGMVWYLESSSIWVARPVSRGTLVEFLAVRLILERVVAEYIAADFMDDPGPLHELGRIGWSRVMKNDPDTLDQRAFLVFQIAQVNGWSPERLQRLSPDDWKEILHELRSFDDVERRRIYQEAFERNYRQTTLDALTVHSRRRRDHDGREAGDSGSPSFQIATCIDDREESFRRHLEEIEPSCETFGAAGFFAVAMNYQGAADAHFKSLCPVVISPRHYVTEDVGYTFEGVHRRRAETRRRLGQVTHQVHSRSRTFVGGIVTGLFGSLATFPLVARVLFPHLTARIRRRAGRLVQPPPVTQLQLERYRPEPGPENGHVGYTLDEMTDIVERLLRDIGLTRKFSRLVAITGHGSSSLNNPHESAHDCGACGGGRGGPNARAFAQMANEWRVRNALIPRGITIPDETHFVGCYHNTCDESVGWFDLDRLPASHREDFEFVKHAVDEARRRNAHERDRRFESANLSLSNSEALSHVEARAEDLSQVRPEYGHCTNAVCIVGRRERTRGLFLDRRAFLTSYDPTQDTDDHAILMRILSAAIPVCAGINLEYYFSRVDPHEYGCGTKLPHNLTGLLGVMDGASSDLRTGLPWQMVEIQEPMRLLFIIETTTDAMLSIMNRNEGIARLCRGDWVQLAVLDAATGDLHEWRHGEFEPFQPTATELPVVKSSAEFYAGNRDHLGYAMIEQSHPDSTERQT